MNQDLNSSIKELIIELLLEALFSPEHRFLIHYYTQNSPFPTLFYSTLRHGDAMLFLKEIWETEGLPGLLKTTDIDLAKVVWEKFVNSSLKPRNIYHMGLNDYRRGFFENLLSEFIRRVFVTLVTYPIDVMAIKYVAQSHWLVNSPRFNGIGEVFRYVYDRDGMAGFYRGFEYQLLLNGGWSLFNVVLAHLFQIYRRSQGNVLVLMLLLAKIALGLSMVMPMESAMRQVKMQAGEKARVTMEEVLGRLGLQNGELEIMGNLVFDLRNRGLPHLMNLVSLYNN